jgi:hypothetical protein
VARTYSITEAARLLGLSAATVSRRLPAERASRGRSAQLSAAELIDVARAARIDTEAVQRRITSDAEFGPDMPAEARRWAEVAAERGLLHALKEHMARVPTDWLEDETKDNENAEFDLPGPWGDLAEWTPISSQEELDALLPPIER